MSQTSVKKAARQINVLLRLSEFLTIETKQKYFINLLLDQVLIFVYLCGIMALLLEN